MSLSESLVVRALEREKAALRLAHPSFDADGLLRVATGCVYTTVPLDWVVTAVFYFGETAAGPRIGFEVKGTTRRTFDLTSAAGELSDDDRLQLLRWARNCLAEFIP